jgi:hypothetical protein
MPGTAEVNCDEYAEKSSGEQFEMNEGRQVALI